MGRLLRLAVMALVAVVVRQTQMAAAAVVAHPIPQISRVRMWMWMWMVEVGAVWVGDVRLPLTLRTHNPRSASSVLRLVVGRRAAFVLNSSFDVQTLLVVVRPILNKPSE